VGESANQDHRLVLCTHDHYSGGCGRGHVLCLSGCDRGLGPGEEPGAIEFIQPKPSVYGSREVYPQKVIEPRRAGTMSGYRVAGITVYPVQYVPSEKKLLFHHRIDFRVHYTAGQVEYRLFKGRQPHSHEAVQRIVERVVLNPQDLDRRSGSPQARLGQPTAWRRYPTHRRPRSPPSLQWAR